MNKPTDNIKRDNKTHINQTYEQLKTRNEAMADLEHANLANIINRMSDHLEKVIAQRDAAVAALRYIANLGELHSAAAASKAIAAAERTANQ